MDKNTNNPRDLIRSAILDQEIEQILVEVFGVEIEIKAPDLEGLLQYRDAADDDSIMAKQIINACYVPNTDEPVFDEADVAALMKAKFSKDMKKLIGAINKALGSDEALEESVKAEAFRTS